MGVKILVAYATRYGSTREVAEVVGATLADHGADVVVRPTTDVADVAGYEAVVLGAPFYLGSMLKDAARFLERHRSTLERMPLAIFTLGPVRASDDIAEAAGQLDKAIADLEWLHPVSAEMFVGAYDPERLRLADRLIAMPPASPMHGLGAHDDRDWDAIRTWAAALPAKVQRVGV